jgi:hypothetical protein
MIAGQLSDFSSVVTRIGEPHLEVTRVTRDILGLAAWCAVSGIG